MSDTQATSQQLAGMVAGYVGTRVVEMGLRHGLLATIASKPGIDHETLADATGLDPFYVGVWSRAAIGAGVVDGTEEAVELAEGVEQVLLDADFPGGMGAMFRTVTRPELMGNFSDRLSSGQRTWWDELDPAFIDAVSGTGRPFYLRLIPGGLEQVPGLDAVLRDGATVLELACGTGTGLLRLAEAYPDARLVGLDGDAHSLEITAARLAEAGLEDRVRLIHSPIEELVADQEYDLILINISMHECRDIEAATQAIRRALRPGGYFVNSDFPFPDTTEGLRTAPGRIMSGIQFFEAQIDDQLLPVSFYLDLLERHGFSDVDRIDIASVHGITYGKA